MVRRVVVLVGLLFVAYGLLLHGQASAGIVGKIVGRTTDMHTGEALPGVNVTLGGTTLGATTDAQGRYVILNVPVGSYSVRASLLGYASVEVKEVKVVQDLATEVNAALPEKTLELKDVIEIIAERPMVQKEVSASITTVSSEEFRNRPIESIQSIVNTSAGVVTSGGATFIRGSRSSEIGYIVDGVPLSNPITGSLMTDISKNAVEEVVLMTGGFSAEYGNAMAGIVNVTTKDGGADLSGSLRYKTDKLSSGAQLYQNANIWDLTFGGPVYRGIRFFLTGYLNLYDMAPGRKVIAPDGTNLGLHPHQGTQEYRSTAKLLIPLSDAMKIRITGSINRTQSLLYNMYWRFGAMSDQLDRCGATWQKTKYAAVVLDHFVAPELFYTVKLGYLDWHSKNGQRDRGEWSGNSVGVNTPWYQDFAFREPFFDQNYRIEGDPRVYSKWRLRDSQGIDDVYSVRTTDAVSPNNPYGVAGGIQNTLDATYFDSFVRSGDRDYYEENRNKQFSARLDATTQPSASYEIKGGFEVIAHRVNRFRIGGMAAQNGIGVTYPIVDFYEKSPSDTALTITSVEDLGDGYTPIELASYVNTQANFDGIFVNLGLRYDYYNAETEFRANPLETTESNPFKQTRVQSLSKAQWSPRLGVSFPVTDRTVLRFNYGHFFQRPPMDRLFSYLWVDLNQADANMGNPNIDPQKTIAYEVGISTEFSEDFALSLTAFQKNMYNLEGYRLFRAPDLEWYMLAVNREYGESQGIEISLRKRPSDWIAGTLTYSFMVARGTSSDVSEISRYPLTSVTYAKEMGYDPLYPQDMTPLDFDRAHSVNLVLDFSIPFDEGPELFGAKLLSGFGINLSGTLQSGSPYTPKTSYFENLTTDRYNSANFPLTGSLDMRIRKDFRFKGVEMTVFADILNVLNLDYPFSVYLASGSADLPSFLVSEGSISSDSYATSSPLYSSWADSNGDGVLDPSERLVAYKRLESDLQAMMPNYALPRRVMFGAEVRF